MRSIAMLLLLATAAPLAAQTPVQRPAERRRDDATAADVRRARDEQRRLRQNLETETRRRSGGESIAADRARRGVVVPAGTRSGRSATELNRVRTDSLSLPISEPLPVITRPVPIDTVSGVPARSRPRAFIMRMSDQPGAPAFCRSGAGHPVYGREWCFERGFRLGDAWERTSARAALVQRPTGGAPRLDRAALQRLVGSTAAERILARRAELALPDSLTARWIATPEGGALLTLVAGNMVIAELHDRNRDGRAEVVWLARTR